MEVKFIDYIRLRIIKARTRGEKHAPLTPFLLDLNKHFSLIIGKTGQEVLDKICYLYRTDRPRKAQIAILVNAYRSYCKGGKTKEEISIRRATAIPYL